MHKILVLRDFVWVIFFHIYHLVTRYFQWRGLATPHRQHLSSLQNISIYYLRQMYDVDVL